MVKIADAEIKRVLQMYDSKQSPLVYYLKPRGTFDIIESRKITKEDFEDDFFKKLQ